MNFPMTYFQDEVREGFYIPGMTKRSWAAQMDILEQVDIICKKYDLKWYADYGTLIGAARHKGFIPWDDDLDICMLRDDYNILNRVLKDELPESYRVLNFDTELNYDNFLTRVTNSSEISFDEESLERRQGFPYVAGIDIFSLDYIYSDNELETIRKVKCKGLWELAQSIIGGTNTNSYDEIVNTVEGISGYKMEYGMPVIPGIYRTLEKLFQEAPRDTAKEVALMRFWTQNDSQKFPLEYFRHTIELPFENTYINAPIAYDKILTMEYGQWAKVNKSGGIHDYPFYRNQENILVQNGYDIPYRFSVRDKSELVKRTRNVSDKNANESLIIFMPVHAKDWRTMEPFYIEACKKTTDGIYVMPLPYMERDNVGNAKDIKTDIEDLPKDLPLIDCTRFNLAEYRISQIWIQNPYDEYESGQVVHPLFYSYNLKKYTDELIYVPWFELDDFESSEEKSVENVKYYAYTSGVINADKVIVSSDCIRMRYVDCLVQNLGEEYRDYFTDKIAVSNVEAKNDTTVNRRGYSSKKKLLVYISFSEIYSNKAKVIKKFESILEIFKSNKEHVEILWIAEDNYEDNIREYCSEVYEDFIRIREQFDKEEIGYRVSIDDTLELVQDADAFYGTGGYVMNMCVRAGKQTMIMDVEIM